MKLLSQLSIKTILVLFIASILANNILGGNIENKKLVFSIPNSIAKIATSEYLSDIIEIPLKNAEPFIAIGFKAEFNSSNIFSNFYLRVSRDGKNWGDWINVKEEEEGSEGNIFLAALNFVHKENKYLQLKVNKFTNLSEITFSFISPGKTEEKKINKNKNNSNLYKITGGIERPEYVSRKDWGCPQSEHVSSRILTNVTHLIIHHSAGSTTSNDFAAVVRSYWDYHVNSNGWDDIGYNWLVDPNGVLYKGRAWKSENEENVIGAHNSGKNSNTTGICFIGNYVSNIPSDLGLNKISQISAFLCEKYGIDPLGHSYHAAIGRDNDNIDGHGQSGGGTACPGTQLINRLQVIRDKTFNLKWDTSTAPRIASTFPASEQDSAYLTKEIQIEFTHPMNQESVKNAFSITPNFVGNISWDAEGRTLYYKPLVPFAPQTNYIITIFKEAASIWEVGLADNFRLSFITKATDNLSLLQTYPIDGAVNVETDLTIELKFDGPIAGNSLGGNISFVDQDSNAIIVLVSSKDYPAGIIRFTPTNSLTENNQYFIYLKDGISTVDGYTFGKDQIISFRTKIITSVAESNFKDSYELFSAYPNPFNPTTTLEFQLKQKSEVRVKVFDITGKEIAKFDKKKYSPGKHQLEFDASNLPSGIYFSQISTGDQIKTIKLILLK